MNIGKIALGVFLGNLMFAVLAWLVIAMAGAGSQSAALQAEANAQYDAMTAPKATPSQP